MTPEPRPIHAMDADELRLTCANLRREISQIAHWRRLVRARLDLTVARAVLPERLGQHAGALGTAAPDLPHGVLVGIARADGAGLSVTDLPRLRSAEDTLTEYETTVRRALLLATDALVDLLSKDPAFRALHLPPESERAGTTEGAVHCTVSQRTQGRL